MNAREFRLVILLGVILAVGGASIGFYFWFWKPLAEYNSTIVRLEKANKDKRLQKEETYNEMRNLERLRTMSLSPKPVDAKSEYENYLFDLLGKCNLSSYDLRQGQISEVKGTGGQAPGTAKPGHQILSYDLRIAKADLRNVVKALQMIQQTPLVHRISRLAIERVDTSAKNTTDQVKVQMTIESLIISRAEARPGGPLAVDPRLSTIEAAAMAQHGPTGLALLPWYFGPSGPFARTQLAIDSAYRDYGDIAKRNIFVGPVPSFRPKDIQTADELPPANFDILQYVRLDTTDATNKEAYFRNLVFPIQPIRAKPYSGFDKINIKDEWRTEDVLRCKLLRVDQRDVYFQKGDSIYRIHIGQSFADAIGPANFPRYMSDEQIEAYGLGPLFDAEYAATEEVLARNKEKEREAAKKKKSKGG